MPSPLLVDRIDWVLGRQGSLIGIGQRSGVVYRLAPRHPNRRGRATSWQVFGMRAIGMWLVGSARSRRTAQRMAAQHEADLRMLPRPTDYRVSA